MATMTQQFPSAGFQPMRTQRIVELETLLAELRQIEQEEVLLLNMAQDRNAQAAVYNELARIETQQQSIVEQLAVVKKQRVVEKARQISEDQRKLVTLMQDAAETEARRSNSPGLGGPRRLSTQYSLRSSGTPMASNGSQPAGYMPRVASQTLLASNTSRRSAGSQGSSGSPRNGYDTSRLAPVRTTLQQTRMAAPAQTEDNGIEFNKKRARPDILEEEKKDPLDNEPDFGQEAKRTRTRGSANLVSGGLPGFKIAKDLFSKRG